MGTRNQTRPTHRTERLKKGDRMPSVLKPPGDPPYKAEVKGHTAQDVKKGEMVRLPPAKGKGGKQAGHPHKPPQPREMKFLAR